MDISDTAFYGYRAIETLKQFFKDKYKLKSEKACWIKMADELGFDQSLTAKIALHAIPVRHGERKPITGTEREEMIGIIMLIIDEYIKYGLNEYVKVQYP